MYPQNVHKHIILILIRSQEHVYFTGFKLIKCSLETFLTVSLVFFLDYEISPTDLFIQ